MFPDTFAKVIVSYINSIPPEKVLYFKLSSLFISLFLRPILSQLQGLLETFAGIGLAAGPAIGGGLNEVTPLVITILN
jgi:hypothetical protein